MVTVPSAIWFARRTDCCREAYWNTSFSGEIGYVRGEDDTHRTDVEWRWAVDFLCFGSGVSFSAFNPVCYRENNGRPCLPDDLFLANSQISISVRKRFFSIPQVGSRVPVCRLGVSRSDSIFISLTQEVSPVSPKTILSPKK